MDVLPFFSLLLPSSLQQRNLARDWSIKRAGGNASDVAKVRTSCPSESLAHSLNIEVTVYGETLQVVRAYGTGQRPSIRAHLNSLDAAWVTRRRARSHTTLARHGGSNGRRGAIRSRRQRCQAGHVEAISGTGEASMGLVFSLYDVGKGNEGKSANIRGVEGSVIGGVIRRDKVMIGKGSELGGPFTGRLVVRTVIAGTRNRHCRRLMLRMRHNLDGVGV